MMGVEEVVRVLPGVRTGLVAHARRENDKGGYEAVGFLAASAGEERVIALLPLHNHAADPRKTYFVEPWEQYRAETRLRDEGYEIVGVYHSHPNSEALPSRMDKDLARAGELMFIYSVAFDTLSAWREHDGELSEVTLDYER